MRASATRCIDFIHLPPLATAQSSSLSDCSTQVSHKGLRHARLGTKLAHTKRSRLLTMMQRFSSALGIAVAMTRAVPPTASGAQGPPPGGPFRLGATGVSLGPDSAAVAVTVRNDGRLRSEERRVGKESRSR